MKKLFTSSSALWSCFVALAMFMSTQSARAEYVKLTAIDGMLSYGQSSPSHAEAYPKLVDADIQTKWGGWFNPALEDDNAWPVNTNESANKMYIIVKAEKAVVPEQYFLVTGNDTGSNTGRNWATWKIYGGNFASDADAVRGGEGWTLIDDKEDEPLPAQNFGVANLDFSEAPSTPYQYFWIEILKSVTGGDEYLQMSEWGVCAYGDFEKYLKDLAAAGTGVDEPVNYFLIDYDPNTAGFGGEGAGNLLDGKSNTKWCTGFTDREKGAKTNGSYIIFKASRAIAPTYYRLTTANDTEQNTGRNWKQWQIYGMNASDDAAVTRDAAGWELIDDREGVPTGTGVNELPAANYTKALFIPTEGNTTEYRYFKVELDKVVTSGLMQMADIALGDGYTIVLDAAELANSVDFDPNLFAEKALLDEMEALIAQARACTDPVRLAELNAAIDAKQVEVNSSASSYAELTTVLNLAVSAINDNNVTEEGLAYLTAWIGETVIAPNDDYPVGNYAYIKANRQITGAQALAEASRINAYIYHHASNIPDPITSVYKFICGTTDNWQTYESPKELIDGDREGTKWGTATSGDRYIVFKSINADTGDDEPIQPSYYGLVTGGDTQKYPERNWKNWKIWGATSLGEGVATDPEDETFNASAVKNSANWVLIDVKQNIGEDILHTTNLFESYIYLSEGCAVPYTYFKIEVYHEGGMQMSEFTFYNQGNFEQNRNEFISEFENYNPDDEKPAYIGYINAFKDKYTEMYNTVSAPELMRLRNELKDLQDQIAESNAKYMEYDDWVTQLMAAGAASNDLQAWYDGYTTENIGPNNIYFNGTYEYIMENLTLDNDAFGQAGEFVVSYSEPDSDGKITRNVSETLPSGEIGYIQNMINAAQKGVYVLLDGHTESQWGDGFYGHLIDGIALNDSVYDDVTGKKELEKATKWGGNADANGNTYIIFRTLDKTNPFFYTLTTGNDTKDHTGRNWGTWYIYGANFEGDVEATKDAEGWVLIDAKENIGQDRLHPVNAEPSYFGFSTETTEKYTYYKVVVTKAYSGVQVQMNELHFGTAEEFEEIKAEYTTAAQNFEYDVVADQALIDEYEATIPEIDKCNNMEALFRVNYKLENLRDAITASKALYEDYAAKVQENKTYLTENNLAPSDALTIFENYLNGAVTDGPSNLYPNGSPAYVLDEHVLNDSVLRLELEFMESLKVAAVAAGYGPGMDITCLIVNRTFAKAGDMLKEENNEIGREAEGWDGYIYRTANGDQKEIYAAEFCNVNKTFNISQTLTNLQNGFYQVSLNAAYRANGDEKMLSYNYAPMAYANDVYTYVPVLREGAAADKDQAWTGIYPDRLIYSADSTETFGYGVWGCEGAAHAFGQGRYAITLVAKVTDGKLTIGVKNDGSTLGNVNEWTGVGNFQLRYLGDEAEAKTAFADAVACNQARIQVLTEAGYYEPVTSDDDENYPAAPNFSAAQRTVLQQNGALASYEALVAVGEAMQSIYTTKKAYIVLQQATTKVYDKWIEAASDPTAMENDVYAVRTGLDDGEYSDADAAKAAKDALYAAWPDYLGVKMLKSGNNDVPSVGKVDYDQVDFSFTIETTGARPYMSLTGLYEDREKDELFLAFDYTADQDIENGLFMYETPNLVTDVKDAIPTLPMTRTRTTVYYNITNAVKAYQFGTVDHAIRWYINYNLKADDAPLALTASNFRFMTKEQMKALGGLPLNFMPGDVNCDVEIDISDAVTVLNAMAGEDVPGNADVNGDGVVDIADFVTVLNIMAGE